jgi:hypothetical protein
MHATTKTRAFAGAVFDMIPGPCGLGHCHYADSVKPTVRSFSYRVDKLPVTDVGLELEIERTDEVHVDRPYTSTHWTQRLFVVCGEITRGNWACKSTESACERAAWAGTAKPSVQSTCTENLGRDAP